MNNNSFLMDTPRGKGKSSSRMIDFGSPPRLNFGSNDAELKQALFEDVEETLPEKVLKQSKASSRYCREILNVLGNLEQLGQGGSSWNIYSVKTDPDVVIKYIDFNRFKKSDLSRSKSRIGSYYKNIQTELEINMILKANRDRMQNVLVPIEVGHCPEDRDEPFFIVMDKYSNSLDKSLELLDDIEIAKKMFTDILIGLSSLQSLNIIHNDLEPRNILIGRNRFIIADFGISEISKKSIKGSKKFLDIAQLFNYLYKKNILRKFLEKITPEPSVYLSDLAEILYKSYGSLEKLNETIQNI